MISPQRRSDIIDALRRGTVPNRSLDVFATGLERFEGAFAAELDRVAGGSAGFKCIRGDYGTGKTFAARWLQEQAKAKGFATAEVQISETETPLHRLETVYRRVIERLSTADCEGAARPCGGNSTAASNPRSEGFAPRSTASMLSTYTRCTPGNPALANAARAMAAKARQSGSSSGRYSRNIGLPSTRM